MRAARHGLPLMLAIIGGGPLQFAPYVDLYHRALRALRQARAAGRRALARATSPPPTSRRSTRSGRTTRRCMNRIGRERGWRADDRASSSSTTAGPDGALFVGSPETVATKIAKVATGLGLSRFDLKYSLGTLPHEQLMESIRLYGTEVAPLVREQLAATEQVATLS